MMTWVTVLAAAVLFTLALLGIALGALFGRRPVKGSCGGLSSGAGHACELCSGDPADCPNKDTTTASAP